MSLRPFEATILESSPRGRDWLKVFGKLTGRIKGPLPRRANVLEQQGTEIYLLDLDSLTGEELARLVEHIAQKFGMPAEVVKRELSEKGCPILAEDVAVPI